MWRQQLPAVAPRPKPMPIRSTGHGTALWAAPAAAAHAGQFNRLWHNLIGRACRAAWTRLSSSGARLHRPRVRTAFRSVPLLLPMLPLVAIGRGATPEATLSASGQRRDRRRAVAAAHAARGVDWPRHDAVGAAVLFAVQLQHFGLLRLDELLPREHAQRRQLLRSTRCIVVRALCHSNSKLKKTQVASAANNMLMTDRQLEAIPVRSYVKNDVRRSKTRFVAM